MNGISFAFITYCLIQTTLWLANSASAKFPRLAPYLKPVDGTDCSLPNVWLYVWSGFMICRFRWLGL